MIVDLGKQVSIQIASVPEQTDQPDDGQRYQ